MHILLGAPNVVRGESTGNNLNAREAIRTGCGDILCSDYAPMSMIHAIYTLERAGILPLHVAVNMVSLNPAKAAGISRQTGSLETGKSADLILVDPQERSRRSPRRSSKAGGTRYDVPIDTRRIRAYIQDEN